LRDGSEIENAQQIHFQPKPRCAGPTQNAAHLANPGGQGACIRETTEIASKRGVDRLFAVRAQRGQVDLVQESGLVGARFDRPVMPRRRALAVS
jgi:hypothetical protein